MSAILEFLVYDSTNTTLLAVLDEAAGRAYQAELNGVGAGKFSYPVGAGTELAPTDLILVSASDTLGITASDMLGWTSTTLVDKSSYLALGNVVRVRLNNTDVGAFLIEDLVEDDLLTPGRVVDVSGRGLLALLERAIVWPSDTATYTSVQKTYLAKTFGYIMRDLLSSASGRGVTVPTTDFTNTVDSAAVSFTDSSTISYRAGTTLLDVAEQHSDLGIEVWVTPAGVLQYYVSKGSNKSSTIIFREGQNAAAASRAQSARQLANAILGEGQYKLSVQTDATSISTYGRRERLAQHGNVSDATTLATLTQLDEAAWKDPQTMVDLRVDDSLVPFVDYTVGDTVGMVLANAGLSTSYRVRAINLEENGDGVIVGVVLNKLIDEHLERLAKAIRRRMMSPIDSPQHGNSDPTVGGWALTDTYLVRDTGTAATSAGMAPDDYPFYAGQTYANRASAPFRVTPAGALTATNATITGTVNWGNSKGQLNTTGLTYDSDANNYVRIDDTSTTLLRVYSNAATNAILGQNTGTATGGAGVYGLCSDANSTGTGVLGVGSKGFGVKGSAAGASTTGVGVYGSGNQYGGQFVSTNVALRAEGLLGVTAAEFDGPVSILDDYLEMDEISDPAAPAANFGRLYVRDNGSGKTQLVVRFSSGAVQVIATQP